MYIDTHSHLNMPDYSDLSEVLERAKSAGVDAMIDVGFDLESSKRSVRLSGSYDQIFSSVGIHPHDAESVTDEHMKELEELAKGTEVVAIGETGLDYYRNLSAKGSQMKIFKKPAKFSARFF